MGNKGGKWVAELSQKRIPKVSHTFEQHAAGRAQPPRFSSFYWTVPKVSVDQPCAVLTPNLCADRGAEPGGGRPPDRVELSHLFLMNLQRSTPINISRYGRSRHKSHDFEELSCLRTTESSQSFSPNLGSPSPPETPDSSHCISRIGDYLLLEPLEGDHVFRAAHLHSGEELVCKVSEKPPTCPPPPPLKSAFRTVQLLQVFWVSLSFFYVHAPVHSHRSAQRLNSCLNC